MMKISRFNFLNHGIWKQMSGTMLYYCGLCHSVVSIFENLLNQRNNKYIIFFIVDIFHQCSSIYTRVAIEICYKIQGLEFSEFVFHN